VTDARAPAALRNDGDDLAAARAGDADAFTRLVEPYRRELHAHCYRLLGSLHDADDALQDAMLGAWRGFAGFEGRSSLRTWLYTIATNASLRAASRRKPRIMAIEYGPARSDPTDLGEIVDDPVFLEPYPDTDLATTTDPEARYDARESVELAFVAMLQHLPATQRAVVVLRDVLAFSAAEAAACLDTTPIAVNSALKRARTTLETRLAPVTQQATRRALGQHRERALVEKFMNAWIDADVDALVDLLTEDARFSMPPLPAWFDGRDDIIGFITTNTPDYEWRLHPSTASGPIAIAHYQRRDDGRFHLGALNVITLRGDRISAMTGFLDPAVHRRMDLLEILAS
jgi:RNA polymerase sigma-70 factor (TIGR02960 family)